MPPIPKRRRKRRVACFTLIDRNGRVICYPWRTASGALSPRGTYTKHGKYLVKRRGSGLQSVRARRAEN